MSEFKYDYLIVDGNYILKRNHSAILRGDSSKNSYNFLVYSFCTSIFKLRKDNSCKSVIVLFDRSPYRSLETIKQYKADRVYINQNDVEAIVAKIGELLAKIASTSDLEEKHKLELELAKLEESKKYLETQAHNNEIFSHARNSIRKNFADSYFNIVSIPGLEADNLCVLIKNIIPEGTRGLLASSDSDWINFVAPNLDFQKLGKTGKLFKYDDSNDNYKEAKELGLDLYKLGIMKELYEGSHNNVPTYPYKDQVSFLKFVACLEKGVNLDLPGFDEYLSYYRAMDVNTYDNTEVVKIIKDIIDNPNRSVSNKRIADYFNALKFNPKMIQKYLELDVYLEELDTL